MWIAMKIEIKLAQKRCTDKLRLPVYQSCLLSILDAQAFAALSVKLHMWGEGGAMGKTSWIALLLFCFRTELPVLSGLVYVVSMGGFVPIQKQMCASFQS